MITYKEAKEIFNIEIDKHINDGYASLTHFWQGDNDSLYKDKAKEYLISVCL